MHISNPKRVIILFFCLFLFSVRPSYAASKNYNAGAIAAGLATCGVGIAGVIIASILSSHDNNSGNDPTSTGTLDDDGVYFIAPGTQYIKLINNSAKSVTVESIEIRGGINGVTAGTIGEGCKSLPPEGTCEAPLIATQEAYGSGQAVLTYNGDKTLIASVAVANTSLQLSEGTTPQNSDILVATNKKSPVMRKFSYTNTGAFSWQNPAISWQTPFDNPRGEEVVTIDNTGSGACNGASLAPGTSCTFSLTVNYDHPGDWGILQATGSNISSYLKNVLAVGGLSIAINQDSSANHLGYRSVKITNTITDPGVGRNMLISDIQVGGNLLDGLPEAKPVVKYCAKNDGAIGDEACVYETDCNIISGSSPGVSLASGESCLVWFKAREKNYDGTGISLQTIPSTLGKISVTVVGKKEEAKKGSSPTTYNWVDYTDYEKSSTFTASYDKSLYVGGKFSKAGEADNTGYIAKWDGSTWSALTESAGAGIGKPVYAFASMRGDLYVGGSFTGVGSTTVNNIAKWNGSTWSGLSSSTGDNPGLGGPVSALSNVNDALYVGGHFATTQGGLTVNNIAKWDGDSSSWQALNHGIAGSANSIYALTSVGSDLYVGGYFTMTIDGVMVKNFTKWSGSDKKWSAFSGTDRPVNALTNMNGNIYAGGNFTSAGGTTINKIAKWNVGTNEWSALLDSGGIAATDDVFALTTLGSDLYVGGKFSKAGLVTANNIVKWDSVNQSWSALIDSSGLVADPGVNGSIYTMIALNDSIYAGGSFSTAGGKTMNYIAQWDSLNKSWLNLGCGIKDKEVDALAIASALTIVGYAAE